MAEKFELYREGKFLDYLEGVATEWMTEAVTSFYDVENIEELTAEQIKHVQEYAEGDSCPDQAYSALRNIIDEWEEEHGEPE